VEKLSTAHVRIADWFRQMKKEFSNLHVAWAWRGKEDQERAFREGKTKARWPHSKHNHVVDETPCSLALDVFQLSEGKAVFPIRYFAEIQRFNEARGNSVLWRGNFRKLVDADHFELSMHL
jgi:hypothetical protein